MTLPHKGKKLWCSNFRFFIKLINLDRCGNLIEKFNFVSTPWKIIIPIANHHPTHNLPHPSLAHHPPSKPQPTLPPTPPPPTPQSNTTHTSLSTTPHHHLNPPHHSHPMNPPTTHSWRKSGALMPGGSCSSPCVLPTCSSWVLITFGILTFHVQIFLNPGRFQNLPAHHPHHNPPSPPPILPHHPHPSSAHTPNPTHSTTHTPPHTPTTPTLHGEKVALMPDISWAPPHSLSIRRITN